MPKETLEEFIERGGIVIKLPAVKPSELFERKLNYNAALQREKGNYYELKAKNLLEEMEINFEYQKVLRPYIVDFFLPEYSVVLEIDGPSHSYSRRKDAKRDSFFRNRGIVTIRIKNKDVSKAHMGKELGALSE